MPATSPISNAIAFGHCQLRGGWKNLGITTVVYSAAIAALIMVSLRMNPTSPATVLATFTSILLGLQLALLVLFGCSTVNSALRTDLTSRMIESHRLMPISSPAAILGYLLGSCSQVLCLVAATFLIGLLTNLGAQTPSGMWIIPNLVLFGFAVFLWITVLSFGFVTKFATTLLFGAAILAFVTQGGVLYLLPGLTVLVSPFSGTTIFARRGISMASHWPWLVSAGAQFVFGAIFFASAARRFRRPERPALGTWLGLALLASWVGVSTLGVACWDDFRPDVPWFSSGDHLIQFLSSTAASILLALIPVANAARADARFQRTRRTGPAARRPAPPILIVLTSAAIILLLSLIAPDRTDRIIAVRIRAIIVIASFLLTCSYLLRIVYRANGKGVVIIGLFMVLVWIVPFVIDLIRHSLADPVAVPGVIDPILTRISTCSPLGALMQLWDRRPLNTDLGVAFQISLSAVAAMLFYLPRLSAAKTARPLSDSPKTL